MEIRKFLAIANVCGLGLCAAPTVLAFGEDDLPELPREVLAWVQNTVHVQVEWIEVDLQDYAKMSYGQKGVFSSNAFRGEVQELIEADRAELKELVMIHTRSGQRAKTESINELIYPTEFDPG